jgi:hypothetical protein
VLGQRGAGTRTEWLVRWEGYSPEDNTWEPLKNLKNAQGALKAFRAQGRATKGGEYHVMVSVTEEIKKRRNKPTTENVEPSQTRIHGLNCLGSPEDEPGQDMSHREVTQGKQDSGTRSVSHDSSTELTGKLCQRMMALIQWKVGADKAVTEHMVWVLEEWLHRRGISIYTDLL